MKRIAWLTDIHLNFVANERVDQFLAHVAGERPDSLVISGDIGESPTVCGYLTRMHEALTVPIYFVLGNHDYYFGAIAETRRRVKELCEELPRLHYVTDEATVSLTSHVTLVGHDGWA